MEMLEAGIYYSALYSGGELCADVMRFRADRRGRLGMVHGVGEIDPDGYVMRMTLWPGSDGLEGTWLQYTPDGTSLLQGVAQFEAQGGRWCGARNFRNEVGKIVAAETWILSPQ